MNPDPGMPPPSRPPSQPAPPPGASAADVAFDPGPGHLWHRVSSRHTFVRGFGGTLWSVPVALLAAWFGWRNGGTPGAVVLLALVASVVVMVWAVAEATRRSFGYAERGDDLILVHGVFVRRLVVVPYGRMQFVDVTSGPLERMFGVGTVRLHTAAAATDARIPSLPLAEAGALRDRLARRGEERSMGL